MAFSSPNFANREVADLVLLDYVTKKPYLNCDFANATATDFTASRVFAKGGQYAPNRVQFDGERAGTLKITTQIMPVKLFAMLSGSDITKSAKLLKREVLAYAATGITLTETPVAGSVQVFAANDDCGIELETTVADKLVTGTGITTGNSYIAYYYTVSTAVQTVSFTSKSFPKAFEVRGSLPMKNEADEICQCNLIYYKAAPQASFSMAFSNTGDPASVDITFDCMADANGNIYDMIFVDNQ